MLELLNYDLQSTEYDSLPDEELDILIAKIQAARQAVDKLKDNQISLQEYHDIEQDSAQAREKLIKSHMRFVVGVIKHFRKYASRHSLEDLLHEGFLGLMNAVERYDSSQGRFTTYAGYFINQRLIIYSQNDRMFIFPANCHDIIREGKKSIELLIADGLPINPENLAEKMDVSLKRAKFILSTILAYESDPTSIELASDDDDAHFIPIPDKGLAPDEKIARETDKEWALEELQFLLDEREFKILKMYYSDRMTLYDIGEEIGVCRERVRQIKRDALAKIRENIDEDAISIA